MTQVRAALRKRPKAAFGWKHWAALPLALAGILLLTHLWLSHHRTSPAMDVQVSTTVPFQFDFYTKLPRMAVDPPAPSPPTDVHAHPNTSSQAR
jgi:hypothetical protein